MSKAETMTLKRPEPALTPEEREKIRKIASGFFAGRVEEKKEQIEEKQEQIKEENQAETSAEKTGENTQNGS